MLSVRTRLGPSPIHGLGVFAIDPIPAGAVVWHLSQWDQRLSDADLAAMHPAALEGIRPWLYLQADGVWILCFDQARFMNHSATPNLDCTSPLFNTARCDINPGDELTCDYGEFDHDDPRAETPTTLPTASKP